jgi:hypothetical protein
MGHAKCVNTRADERPTAEIARSEDFLLYTTYDVRNVQRMAKRVHLAKNGDGKKDFRRSTSEFREAQAKILNRVAAGEAFVISRRVPAKDESKGWDEEDIAILVPLGTSAREFEGIVDQLQVDAAEAAEREAAYQEDDIKQVRSDVRVIGQAGDVKRGRRQHG